ncbi:MAG: retroviral-like aspartic protease family protein [bacterium]|nr:retroviral-like aspartic protease family protein [bacterium]
MGVFKVPIQVRNWQNRFLPEELQGQDVSCDALVDSGAAELSLPANLVEQLKLEELGTIRAYTADGAEHEYRIMGMTEVEVQGRICQVRVIEIPRGAEPLLGAVPLEEMDWHISPMEKKLMPNPKSPERPLLPLC